MRSKEQAAELSDRIVSKLIWGRLQKILALKVHIGDNGLWKYFSKLSNRLRRALVRVMTKKLMVIG